jgi:ATP-dependent protease ClpP protease subunit
VAAAGTPEQIAAQSEQHRALLGRFQARVAKATGRAAKDVAEDMRRGRYLEARKAVEHGVIDGIRS